MKLFGVILQESGLTNNKWRWTMSIPAKSTSDRRSVARRELITAATLGIVAVATRSSVVLAQSNAETSKDEEAIHQERVFGAGRQRVYQALTVEKQFDKIIQLSGVMKTDAMAKMHKSTMLSQQAGGPFALFGGHIVGRQIELVPNDLIVQAWRVQSWSPGLYSIARFVLSDQGGSTKLVFDHTGFPKGQAEHLASGWQEHYWDPLSRFLA
jgi:activator of HSP90 ATPase